MGWGPWGEVCNGGVCFRSPFGVTAPSLPLILLIFFYMVGRDGVGLTQANSTWLCSFFAILLFKASAIFLKSPICEVWAEAVLSSFSILLTLSSNQSSLNEVILEFFVPCATD